MSAGYAPDLLERLRAVEEVEIATSTGTGTPVHRTIIWVIVDAAGRVLIRTYLGPTSRWYREASRHADCVLHLPGLAIPVIALPVSDPSLIAACSRGYLEKYASHGAAPRMVAAENLPTTLQLVPR